LAWLCALLLMQTVFTLLVVDGDGPCLLERWLPFLASLPKLVGIRGVMCWSTFRYDALRLISFAADVTDAEAEPHFASFLAYQLYPPLAPAGPVICYADFAQQLSSPRPWPRRVVAKYLLQLGALLCLIEASMYVLYFPAWLGPQTSREGLLALPPWMLFGGIHWILQFEWLSLTAVWRVTRGVALVDGIEAPEDMLGTLCFPGSFKEVWRLWHASLNLWSVRYIYRPLGGRLRAWLAVPATFLFVAFWHDVRGFGDRPFWYVWAVLNSAFMLLESKALGRTRTHRLPVALVAMLAASSVLALVVANMPALMYRNSFSIIWAIIFREGSAALMVTLALVFGAGAVFSASSPELHAEEAGKRLAP